MDLVYNLHNIIEGKYDLLYKNNMCVNHLISYNTFVIV